MLITSEAHITAQYVIKVIHQYQKTLSPINVKKLIKVIH
jgi:putative component of membrane protein insertase Oxa1/YidC/SpoIIIJ protein YidD